MMTKREIIQKAYKHNWEVFKGLVDENGWVKSDDIPTSYDSWFDNWTGQDTGEVRARPSSLDNIETNNNWVKINNISELPVNGFYFAYNKFSKRVEIDYIESELDVERWMEFNSHYQPITEPKPPIY